MQNCGMTYNGPKGKFPENFSDRYTLVETQILKYKNNYLSK
jgi:hypothetical protein